MIKTYYSEVLDTAKYALGEGPYYDPRFDRFSWVDITGNRLYTMTAEGEKSHFDLGQPVGAAIPLKHSEGFLLAAADGLYIYENGKARLAKDLKKAYKPYWRSNDAKADDDHEPEGALFCYDASSKAGDVDSFLTCLQPDTKIANGMAFSSDKRHFFFSDSLEYVVFKYDYDQETGKISGREPLFDIEGGVPDGMCIDCEDNLWVAIWGGGRIEKRSSKSGKKLAEVLVSAQHTTSCCFGGKDLTTLYITSSGEGLDGDFDGCLFTCNPGVAGVAPDYAKM